MSTSLWHTLDRFVQTSRIAIDRPKGSPHPRYPEIMYPLDYGYLSGTSAGDGDGIDIWIGSLPDKTLDAIICTADPAKRDAEIKLLLGCTGEEKQIVCDFFKTYGIGALLIPRPE